MASTVLIFTKFTFLTGIQGRSFMLHFTTIVEEMCKLGYKLICALK
jgi:hypothetical protein